MNRKQDLQFKLFVTTLGVWLILGSLVMGWVDSTFYLLAFGLLALTTTLSLIYPARWLSIGVTLASTGLFIVVQLLMYGFVPRVAFTSLLCFLVLGGAAVLGMLANRHFTRVVQQLEQQNKLVDELRLYDPDTNLLRYTYALQTLKTEIARSQRYNRQVCLFFLQVSEPVEWTRAPEAKPRAYQHLAALLRESLRAVDVPFIHDTNLGAILPETDPAGARLVCERLAERIANKLRLAVHIGVAHFPSDGVTEEELVRGAQAALHLAVTTKQPLVFYVQLRHAVQPAPATPPLELPTNQPTAPASHTGVVITVSGLRNIADIVRIEQALRDYVGVTNVQSVRFTEGTLVLQVNHLPDGLTQQLSELIALPVEQVTQDSHGIHVQVKDGASA